MLILSHSADGCAVVQARGCSADRPGGLSHHDIANSRNPSGARAGPGGPAQAWRPAPLATMALRCNRHELLPGEPGRLSRRAEDVPAHSQHQHAFRAPARYPARRRVRPERTARRGAHRRTNRRRRQSAGFCGVDVRGQDIFARGSSDDKGQTYILIKAVEGLLKTRGKLPVNVKFLIEGEEETGGEHIESYVGQQPARIACDAAIICDTEMFAPELPTICIGLRGMVSAELHVEGANHD